MLLMYSVSSSFCCNLLNSCCIWQSQLTKVVVTFYNFDSLSGCHIWQSQLTEWLSHLKSPWLLVSIGPHPRSDPVMWFDQFLWDTLRYTVSLVCSTGFSIPTDQSVRLESESGVRLVLFFFFVNCTIIWWNDVWSWCHKGQPTWPRLWFHSQSVKPCYLIGHCAIACIQQSLCVEDTGV